jgi:hypothetical protein
VLVVGLALVAAAGAKAPVEMYLENSARDRPECSATSGKAPANHLRELCARREATRSARAADAPGSGAGASITGAMIVVAVVVSGGMLILLFRGHEPDGGRPAPSS